VIALEYCFKGVKISDTYTFGLLVHINKFPHSSGINSKEQTHWPVFSSKLKSVTLAKPIALVKPVVLKYYPDMNTILEFHHNLASFWVCFISKHMHTFAL